MQSDIMINLATALDDHRLPAAICWRLMLPGGEFFGVQSVGDINHLINRMSRVTATKRRIMAIVASRTITSKCDKPDVLGI
ncbi:hypothetical protein EAN76_20120 [Klebsiella pneumoniae]|nr:hypothetical protein EAN76_20120 [Klebsiella pneumoniae]